MSIGSVPAQGWLDDQAITQWDVGTTFVDTGSHTGAATYGPYFVSPWASIYYKHKGRNANFQWTENFQWYDSQALTNNCGGREFTYDNAIINAFEVNLPHFGPWLQITVTPSDLVDPWLALNIGVLNNRVTPTPSMPDGLLIDIATISLAAGASQTKPFSQIPGCKCGFYTQGGTQGADFKLQFLTYGFVYTTFAHWTVAANLDDYREIIVPMHAVQYVVTNLSGANPATGIGYTSWMSMTGA